jgi:F0F1-type ATP synthase assembly protein I
MADEKSASASTIKTALTWVAIIAVGVFVGGILSHYVATKMTVTAPAAAA